LQHAGHEVRGARASPRTGHARQPEAKHVANVDLSGPRVRHQRGPRDQPDHQQGARNGLLLGLAEQVVQDRDRQDRAARAEQAQAQSDRQRAEQCRHHGAAGR
jgi:hypothetical protein